MSVPLGSTFLSNTLLSHTGYKYRLLLVHCYILPLKPRPFPVPCMQHSVRELQWRLAVYLIRGYHKKPVATATAPYVSIATGRHVKVVHSPFTERGGDDGEWWNRKQPEKRRRKRAKFEWIWPLLVTSGCCGTHPERNWKIQSSMCENISKNVFLQWQVINKQRSQKCDKYWWWPTSTK